MGADLYIINMDRKKQYLGFEISQKAIDAGYFRDCYNDYGLFNYIRSNTSEELKSKFSWWQMCDNKAWFNKSGNMTTKGAIKFLQLVKKAKAEIDKKDEHILNIFDPEATKMNFRDMKYKLLKLGKKEDEEFQKHLSFLIQFLVKSIELESNILWSV